MRAAAMCATRNMYGDLGPPIKALLVNSDVEKIYILAEDPDPGVWLPPECEVIDVSGAWETESPEAELQALHAANKGDDTFFREFLFCRHGEISVTNLRPNLVEHVDLLLGGSVLHPYRDYRATAYYWPDPELTEQLRAELRARRLGAWAT